MKKGYVVVNLLCILAIISLILIISSKIVYNNEFQNNIDINSRNKYIDADLELKLCKINYIIHKNNVDLNKLVNSNETIYMENDSISICFDKNNNRFKIVCFDDYDKRYDFNVRYEEDEEGKVFIIPEKKYAISTR
ncbi:MAG: hypothetical protein PUE01_07755 [Clostridiaceae bacterium]|nr:hypothetical protein [Clostridiaceae bacterium]